MASGAVAYAFSISNGISVSYDRLQFTSSQIYSTSQSQTVQYTGRYGVSCLSGDGNCEAVSPTQ